MVYSHMEYLEVYAHSFILLLSYLIIEFIYNTNAVYLKFIIFIMNYSHKKEQFRMNIRK
jgi:hypothetical protein